MDHMAFPQPFTTSIHNLFFSTNISLNINGHLARPFRQRRGLRQGDPLSPFLFNLAFEAFLCAVNADFGIEGITIRTKDGATKFFAYADDLAVFIRSWAEWEQLKRLFQQFGAISNARLNVDKTVVFPLGQQSPTLKQQFQAAGIEWVDGDSDEPTRYLGYPIVHTPAQLEFFYDKLATKIERAADIHSARQLSVKGRALIANALLLATLWHVARVHPPTTRITERINKAIRTFTMPFFPRPSLATAQLTKDRGGLGLLNITHQSTAFQLGSLQHMIKKPESLATQVLGAVIEKETGAPTWRMVFAFPNHCNFRTALQHFSAITTMIKSTKQLSVISLADNDTTSAISILHSPADLWLTSGTDFQLHTKLRMDELFQLHPTEHYLQPIDWDEASSSARRLLNRIDAGTVICSPRLQSLLEGPHPQAQDKLSSALLARDLKGFPLEVLSTRTIRTALSQEEPTEEETKQAPHWRRLWKEKLEHRSRTILWRLHHDKLSNGQRMHKINPERPATCHTCGEEETTEHMVATCDAKRTVWETCLTTYSTNTIWNNTTILSLLKLHKIPLKLKQTTQFTKLQLIGSTLLSIWDHHWRTKLDNSIFLRIVGQAAALRRLRTLHRQITFSHSTSI
jgi:hypothetical protein